MGTWSLELADTGSRRSGKGAYVIMSLIQSVRMKRHDVYAYHEDVPSRFSARPLMHATHPADGGPVETHTRVQVVIRARALTPKLKEARTP